MKQYTRALVYVPIYHNPWLENGTHYASKTTLLPTDVPDFLQELDRYWDEIDGVLATLPVNKVYQDSLDAHPDDEWRAFFAKGEEYGSRNFSSVHRLLERGARLMKTESAVEFRRYMRDVKADKVSGAKELRQRDAFIARTIDRTLSSGELGVLFLGFGHGVDTIIRRKYKTLFCARFEPSNSQEMFEAFDRAATLAYEKRTR